MVIGSHARGKNLLVLKKKKQEDFSPWGARR